MIAWWVQVSFAGPSFGCPQVGDVVRYNVIAERVRTSGPEGPTKSLGRTTNTHRLEVLSVDGTVLRLADTTESGTLLAPASDPQTNAIIAALTEVRPPRIVLVVDSAKGTVTVEDVSPLTIAYAPTAEKLVARFGERIRSSLLDPALLRANATRAMTPLSWALCAASTRTTEYATWVPDVFGGTQMRGEGRRELGGTKAETTVRVTEAPLQAALGEVALGWLDRAGQPRPPTGAEAIATLDLAVLHEHQLLIRRGEVWPETWTSTWSTTSTGPSQVETVRVERQPVEESP